MFLACHYTYSVYQNRANRTRLHHLSFQRLRAGCVYHMFLSIPTTYVFSSS